jgi:hypothetical protein
VVVLLCALAVKAHADATVISANIRIPLAVFMCFLREIVLVFRCCAMAVLVSADKVLNPSRAAFVARKDSIPGHG